jgi:hypothetical protein
MPVRDREMASSRRTFLQNGARAAGVLGASLLLPRLFGAAAQAQDDFPPISAPRRVRPALLAKALLALDRHGDRIAERDRIAIADFNAPSSEPRFYLVDLGNGATTAFLVAHGKGSDPDHTGWLQFFSNEDGSNASSEGVFLTSDYYVGQHGASQRLIGLDPTNCNAESRAIIIHSAWYANPDILLTQPVLGRSDGCFTLGEAEIDMVFDRLGPGRMLYSTKI